MNWEQLCRFHLNPPKIQISRTSEDAYKYYVYKKELKESIDEDIIRTYFEDQNTIKQGWTIVDNLFPYDLPPDVKHLIIWIHPSATLLDNEIYRRIEYSMKKHGYDDFIYFENRKNSRSVEKVKHFHILVRIH